MPTAHNLVMLEIKSSIAWILRISLLLIPLLDQTLAGNDEGVGADFRTEGEVKTRRGGSGEMTGQIRRTRMAYYRAKTMISVPSGAQTHLPLLLLPQSLSGSSFFTAAFTPQSSPLQFAL